MSMYLRVEKGIFHYSVTFETLKEDGSKDGESNITIELHCVELSF